MKWTDLIMGMFVTLAILIGILGMFYAMHLSSEMATELDMEKEKTRQMLIENAESGKSIIIFE